MHDCPNNDPVFFWRYLSEEKQRILGADDYSVTERKLQYPGGQCENVRYKMRVYQLVPENKLNGNNSPLYADRETIFTDGLIYDYPIWDVQLYDHKGVLINYDIYQALGKNFQDDYQLKVFVLKDERPLYWHTYSFRQSWGFIPKDFVPLDPEPEERCKICILRFYKDGDIVYERIRGKCPEVLYECGETCPDGTCECEHPGKLCCYDPKTGLLVKTIKK